MWNNCGNCNSPYRISQYHAYPDNCVALPIQTDDLVYSGPNLPCTGIRTCNTVTVAIQKIDEKICELIDMIYECCNPTTTTTTTSELTTTTTTTVLECDLEGEASYVTTTTTTTINCDLEGEASVI